MKDTRILAIESSCDETSAAVVKNGTEVLSNVVYSQIATHAKTGGVVPEVAAREHAVKIIPVVQEAMRKAKTKKDALDAIAVTTGPGLITSLLVGVDTAKTLAYTWNKPLIAVNHLDGHLAAAGVTKLHTKGRPKTFKVKALFPRVLLLISGGHTQLFLEEKQGVRKMLGQTLDDAAGEAFDKAAAVMNLPYPGGPSLSKLATSGDPEAYAFPRPMANSDNYMFSYSGLKTAFIDEVRNLKSKGGKVPANLAASFEQAIIDSLFIKTRKAVQEFRAKQVVVAGGVAANRKLRKHFAKEFGQENIDLLIPDIRLCTDNAAMIGAQAFTEFKDKSFDDPRKLEANTNFPLYQKTR